MRFTDDSPLVPPSSLASTTQPKELPLTQRGRTGSDMADPDPPRSLVAERMELVPTEGSARREPPGISGEANPEWCGASRQGPGATSERLGREALVRQRGPVRPNAFRCGGGSVCRQRRERDASDDVGPVNGQPGWLVPKLRREAVDLHLGVLVVAEQADGTFNYLAHRRH